MTNIEDKDWSRSEGDSWDIVSSVGFTALGVAAARAVENREADPLVRDPYAEHFVRAAGEPHLIGLLDSSEPKPPNPGTAPRHIGLRSKFLTNSLLTQRIRGANRR